MFPENALGGLLTLEFSLLCAGFATILLTGLRIFELLALLVLIFLRLLWFLLFLSLGWLWCRRGSAALVSLFGVCHSIHALGRQVTEWFSKTGTLHIFERLAAIRPNANFALRTNPTSIKPTFAVIRS